MYECIIYAWPVIFSLSDGGVGGGDGTLTHVEVGGNQCSEEGV